MTTPKRGSPRWRRRAGSALALFVALCLGACVYSQTALVDATNGDEPLPAHCFILSSDSRTGRIALTTVVERDHHYMLQGPADPKGVLPAPQQVFFRRLDGNYYIAQTLDDLALSPTRGEFEYNIFRLDGPNQYSQADISPAADEAAKWRLSPMQSGNETSSSFYVTSWRQLRGLALDEIAGGSLQWTAVNVVNDAATARATAEAENAAADNAAADANADAANVAQPATPRGPGGLIAAGLLLLFLLGAAAIVLGWLARRARPPSA